MNSSEKNDPQLDENEPLRNWLSVQEYTAIVSIIMASIMEPNLVIPALYSAYASHELLRVMANTKSEEFDRKRLLKAMALFAPYVGFVASMSYFVNFREYATESQIFLAIPIIIAMSGAGHEINNALRELLAHK
jgi:hypothetical protein